MSRETRLEEVRVESNGRKDRRSRTNEFVYVNDAYVGSVNSVNAESRTVVRTSAPAPISGVYREQYCVCSRWPYTQRVLAIAVGVLLGALIGLALSMIIRGEDENVIGPIFRNSVPD